MNKTQRDLLPYLLTAQEHAFIGSTPERETTGDQNYVPQGILLGLSRSMIQAERRRLGFVINEKIGMSLLGDTPGDSIVGFKLEDLDVENSRTVRDPDLRLGLWDRKKREITGVSLTERLALFQRDTGGRGLSLRGENMPSGVEGSGVVG